MRKILTLALALVMALGFAIPAMAFTGTEYEDSSDEIPYELSIMLVDTDAINGFNYFSLPADNRGYVKNEVVCAIGAVYVPKGENLGKDSYQSVRLGGDGVDLGAVNYSLITSSNVTATYFGTPAFSRNDNEWTVPVKSAAVGSNQSFGFAFYGKVTSDDALMYIELTKNAAFKSVTGATNTNTAQLINFVTKDTLGADSKYSVYSYGKYAIVHYGNYYIVTEDTLSSAGELTKTYADAQNRATLKFFVKVNSKAQTTGLFVYTPGGDPSVSEGFYEAGQNTSGKSGFSVNSYFMTGSSTPVDNTVYTGMNRILTDVFEDTFDMDLALLGNVLKESYFTGRDSADDLYEEVVVEPFVAHVEIPPEIEINPPKTGDAASIMGFVMIAVAVLAIVAVKKARA